MYKHDRSLLYSNSPCKGTCSVINCRNTQNRVKTSKQDTCIKILKSKTFLLSQIQIFSISDSKLRQCLRMRFPKVNFGTPRLPYVIFFKIINAALTSQLQNALSITTGSPVSPLVVLSGLLRGPWCNVYFMRMAKGDVLSLKFV